MTVGEKIRYLREVEGQLRGLGRPLSQQELVRGIKKETGKPLSQSYLSQLESGARPHMTNKSRAILAEFFKVHPGYLVDDPPGYHEHILSKELRSTENSLDVWLFQGAERFAGDHALSEALVTIAKQADSRRAVRLLQEILETPGLQDRLWETLAKARNGKGESR